MERLEVRRGEYRIVAFWRHGTGNVQPNASVLGIRPAFKNVNRVCRYDDSASFMDRDAPVAVHFVCRDALQAEYQFDVRMYVRMCEYRLRRHPLCYAHKPAKSDLFRIDLVTDMHVAIVFHGAYYTPSNEKLYSARKALREKNPSLQLAFS